MSSLAKCLLWFGLLELLSGAAVAVGGCCTDTLSSPLVNVMKEVFKSSLLCVRRRELFHFLNTLLIQRHLMCVCVCVCTLSKILPVYFGAHFVLF